tara:strand:+ start:127 stop:381 length:255 start_codon:yes stop_codon:yes gene_type:complete
MDKIYSTKGVLLFLLTFLLFTVTNHVKSDYISYIGLNNIKGLFNLGPILVKKNFVYGLVLSVLLTVLHTGFSLTGLLEKIINLD